MVKISACLIVRDEQHTIEACLSSIRPYVDEIIVVDTGSVDDTPEIVRRFADKTETFLDCNETESGLIADFSCARNRSFELATNDVVLWLDGDDTVVGAENLPKLAAEISQHENGQILLPYQYAHDERGRVTLLQYRERLLYPRRHWEWRFPVHENCLLGAGHELKFVKRDESVRMVHAFGTSPKIREADRNWRILRAYIDRVGETDERSLYYLGSEYGLKAMRAYGVGDTGGFLEHTGNSLRILKRYVQISRWEDEKALALLEIARHYQRLNDHVHAIEWALQASTIKSWPEPYWCLLYSYYSLSTQEKQHQLYNLKRGAHFGQLGMSLVPSDVAQTLLAQNPTERFRACEILAFCQAGIGDIQSAIQTLEVGTAGLPEHTKMLENLTELRIERSKRLVLSEVQALVDAKAIGDGADTIIKGALRGDFTVRLLETPIDMPDSAAGGAVLADGDRARLSGGAAIDSRPARNPGKLELIFFCGEGLEPWNGETIARSGIGGSETMAWELARRLARRGHGVRLVGHCGPSAPAGRYDGVDFIGQREFFTVGADRTCDVLIASRQPAVVDDGAGITAGARLLWIHDVTCGPALNHKRNIRFDRILALSNWHRSILQRSYPLIDPAKILVTRNGIDLKRFDGKETRNARRAIYSSSPDRGLETLLDIWPIVRKSIPDAELHVFYGFDAWEATVAMMGAAGENELKRIRHIKDKLGRTPGVRVRGRVDQAELAREQMRSGVWAYPTAFTETSCITAMEAQAAGCRIVTSPLAALNETVGNRGQLIPGFGTPGYVDMFAAAVVMAMQEGIDRKMVDDRALLQEHARNSFSLDTLAEEWESMLITTLEDVRKRVVPAFHKAVVA
jgi:glycosyltransferase involved in cell wall biosynthesis